jgi:hypothetical protein
MSDPIWSAKIDIRFVSANPIVKLFVLIGAVFEFFSGIRRKGTLNEYENRIEINRQNYFIWFWNTSATTTIIQKQNIIGYTVGFTKTWIFWNCVVGQLHVGGSAADDEMVFKGVSFAEMENKFRDMFERI